MATKTPEISVIIPLYNEARVIERVIRELHDYLALHGHAAEIIAVDDGSTDGSGTLLSALSIPALSVVTHPQNRGYGAALKTGAALARGAALAFYDSDGQHTPEMLGRLLAEHSRYDMVVGAREGYKGPLWRQPGKRLIGALGSYLVRFRIPDLNSGLRVVRKDVFEKFRHLYPNGFSLSTTITLALLREGFAVRYVPITVLRREGKSTVRLRDGFFAISLILRMIMLFAPFRIFTPISGVLFALACVSLAVDIAERNIADSTILLGVSALLIFLFGLLADQIAAVRRELGGSRS